MARRRRNQQTDGVEVIVKLAFILIMMIALGVGGFGGFAAILGALARIVLWLAGLAVLVFIGWVIYRKWWIPRSQTGIHPTTWARPPQPEQAPRTPFAGSANSGWQGQPAANRANQASPSWTAASVLTALGEIDWFQFERFCAALLRTEGYEVTRKGGAQPDGGVDLIAVKGNERILVQCKHWRTWTVQEKVIREMLGSMTHFQVSCGAIYTLNGWTKPAAGFALSHSITLVDGEELARRAVARLTGEQLDKVLDASEHFRLETRQSG